MAVTSTIYDAAHQYGLDNMVINDALGAASQKIVGDVVSEVDDWGTGSIAVGQTGTITMELSGGFEQKITFLYTDEDHGNITGTYLYKMGGALLGSTTGNIAFTVETWDSAFDLSHELAGNDTVNGNAYNNILKGYAGNDKIDGGAGTDTVVYDSNFSQYNVTKTATGLMVSGPDGTDTLTNVERLQFGDVTRFYDVNGTGGEAYRLYQAAFDRVPDSAGLGVQIWAMDSAGLSLTQVANNFVQSAEFIQKYEANGPLSNIDFVTQLYANVLHRAPDQAGLDYQVSFLDANTLTRAQILIGFSESAENQANVISLIGNGFSYTAYTPHT